MENCEQWLKEVAAIAVAFKKQTGGPAPMMIAQ